MEDTKTPDSKPPRGAGSFCIPRAALNALLDNGATAYEVCTYLTLATVMEASFETLCTWCDKLPAPQNDVQRTVLRRLKARRDELLGQQVREKAPQIAEKFNDILDRMERLGIKSPVRRM